MKQIKDLPFQNKNLYELNVMPIDGQQGERHEAHYKHNIHKHVQAAHTTRYACGPSQPCWMFKHGIAKCGIIMLAYMAINIDFDDNKPHAFIKQRFINYAFMML